ncbi:MAG: bacitracin resistance protein BacA [Leptonema sp. (in: bacteria)]
MTFIPPRGIPQETAPKLFPILGEENIRKLLKYHYEFISKSEIRDLFPKGEELYMAAQKNADFFIQILGGPPYFSMKYGPPKMRQRHLRFSINYKKRKVWLKCFFKAIQELTKEVVIPKTELKKFKLFLIRFSEWMVNEK